MADQMVSFDWEVEAPQTIADADRIAQDIRDEGGTAKVVDHTDKEILPAIPFVAAVWGIIQLGRFAVYVAEKLRDWGKSGIQITNNGKKVSIRHLDIPYGWILYTDPKGVAHLYDTKQDLETTKTILDAAGKGLVPDVPTASTTTAPEQRATAGA
jgi:hypothetical protein